MEFLFEPHKELLRLLVKHKVDFLLIGGYSVIYYGYNRGTNDLDIWLKPNNKNKEKLLQALGEFGVNKSDIEKLSTTDFSKTSMFFIGKAPYKIDFLTRVQNVDWDNAIKNVKYYPFEKLQIPIVGFNELILMKMATDRMKDKADVVELQRIRKNRK